MTRVILFGSYFRPFSAFVLEVLMSIRELDYEQSLLYNEVRSATDIASKKSSSVANNSRQFFFKLQSPHIYRSNLPAYYASGFSVFKTYLTTGFKESLLDNSLSFLTYQTLSPVRRTFVFPRFQVYATTNPT